MRAWLKCGAVAAVLVGASAGWAAALATGGRARTFGPSSGLLADGARIGGTFGVTAAETGKSSRFGFPGLFIERLRDGGEGGRGYGRALRGDSPARRWKPRENPLR